MSEGKASVEVTREVNTLLLRIMAVLREYSIQELEEMRKVLKLGEDASTVFMAFGATPEWLDTVSAKKDVLDCLMKIRRHMEERRI